MADDEKVLEKTNQIPESHVDSGDLLHKKSPTSLEDVLNLLRLSRHEVMINFNKNIDINNAIDFITAIDAVACVPETVILQDKDNLGTNSTYTFVANAIQTRLFLDTVPDILNPKDAVFIELGDQSSSKFANTHKKATKANMVIHDLGKSIIDRLNFLRFLYLELDTGTTKETPEFIISRDIFKQFMLAKITKIESETDEQKQMKMLVDLMQQIMFTEKYLETKANKFSNFGFLPKTSVAICTKDGIFANLLDLDQTKHYELIHSVNVSKLSQPFDFSNIDIRGDFTCINQKKFAIVFPNKINGFFNCSGYGFEIKRIPDGAKKVDLSHTCVKSFVDLNKIAIPYDICELILDSAIIKNIAKLFGTKNSGDNDEIIAYTEFMQKHPLVQIKNSGGCIVLAQELQKVSQNTVKQPAKTVEPISVTQPEIPVYTESTKDWILRKRLVTLLSSEEQFADVKNLDNIVKQVLARNNLIVRQQKMIFEGNTVPCIHTGDIDKVKELLSQFVNTPTVAKTQAEKPAVVTTAVASEQKKTKKAKGIKFKKYMPASVYKQIDKACGKNTMLLISVLERIAMINTDYTTLQGDDPLQHVDKNGQFHNIQNTQHKYSKAASVSFVGLDNRRIVLTINPQDKIVVAIAFFADHVNNKKNDQQYNDVAIPNAAKGYLMDGKTPVTRDLVQSGDYIDIAEKLKELKKTTEQAFVVTQQETVTVVKTTTTKVTVAPRQKRKRINTATPVAIASNGDVQSSLLDVMALEEEVYAIVNMLEEKIKELKAKEAPNSVMERLQNRLIEICRS